MNIEKHDIVQVNKNHEWTGCLVYVTDVKSWGIQGFVQIPLEGQAFIRLKDDEFEFIGRAALRIEA